MATQCTHAKLILIGEHSAVYGQPAIALPFRAVETCAVFEPLPGALRIESSLYSGPLRGAPAALAGVAACAEEALACVGGTMRDVCLRISSTIPPGCGLGSSAAVAAGVVRAAYALVGRRPRREELLSLVMLAERQAHGKPSGLDAAAVLSTRPLWFRASKGRGLHVAGPVHFVVAHTGVLATTRAAVEAVRRLRTRQPQKTDRTLGRLGELAYAARGALASGDAQALGRAVDAAQVELERLEVSSPQIERLIAEARGGGAMGAKLTGGGRGGCILAVARDAPHAISLAAALRAAGATRTWTLCVGEGA